MATHTRPGRAGASQCRLPHDIKRLGLESGVYVRVGSTNRHADRELVDELRRFARGEAYDEQPMPELDSEALDFRAASELFAPIHALRRPEMETLRLITVHQGRKVPTVGGMLLFGKDRERHFPDAWIQAGRFEGTNKSRIIDRVEVRSHLVQAVDDAIAFVQKHTLHGAEIGAVRRAERWNLPPVAVREAVVNAIAHADYAQRGAPIRVAIFDDRLEVEHPGLLPFGLTVADLRRGISKLRNRVVGRVFHRLGLIGQWGRVTSDIAHVIRLTSRATRTRLARLVERRLLREVGTSPQDPRRRYFLVD